MCTVNSPSEVSVLSTTTVITISLLVAVLLYTCGVITGLLIQRLRYKHHRKMRLDSNAVMVDDPLPTSVTHTSELTPVYEDILPPEKQIKTKKIELQENVAYGPIAIAST